MGYLNSEHIKSFAKDKVVESIEEDTAGMFWIQFKDGTKLRLYPHTQHQSGKIPTFEIIATPYGADGNVVQSMDIMDEIFNDVELPACKVFGVVMAQAFYRRYQKRGTVPYEEAELELADHITNNALFWYSQELIRLGIVEPDTKKEG